MTARPCIEPGCNNLTPNTRCPTHQRPINTAKRRRAHYQNGWRTLSLRHRQANPVCVYCGATNDLTVDHVIPGTLDGGIQTLCRSCNSRKSNN